MIYGSVERANDTRSEIVHHIEQNWGRFALQVEENSSITDSNTYPMVMGTNIEIHRRSQGSTWRYNMEVKIIVKDAENWKYSILLKPDIVERSMILLSRGDFVMI